MTDLPPARGLVRAPRDDVHDRVVLTHDRRFMRRRRLVTMQGESFEVDLPKTMCLDGYFGFELEDGRIIRIVAAAEDLMAVTGDLARLAWHIGNRHGACQIEATRLLLRPDPAMEEMLTRLGATVEPVVEPFTPEVAAQGVGGAAGHAHGPRPAAPVQVRYHGRDENPFAGDDGGTSQESR